MKILTTAGTSLCSNLMKETRNDTISNSIASLENSEWFQNEYVNLINSENTKLTFYKEN